MWQSLIADHHEKHKNDEGPSDYHTSFVCLQYSGLSFAIIILDSEVKSYPISKKTKTG